MMSDHDHVPRHHLILDAGNWNAVQASYSPQVTADQTPDLEVRNVITH